MNLPPCDLSDPWSGGEGGVRENLEGRSSQASLITMSKSRIPVVRWKKQHGEGGGQSWVLMEKDSAPAIL